VGAVQLEDLDEHADIGSVASASFLFVVGTGRCGSTLLAQILAAHPKIGCISAGGRRGRVGRAVRLKRPPPNPSEAYDLLQKHVSPMPARPFRDLTADDAMPWLERRMRTFFEHRAQARGRPVFMHKLTGWPRARLLAAVFPEAKFVHVFRDGRGVASSYVQVRWWQGYSGVPGWTFGHLSDEERREWEATGCSWTHLAALEWKRLMDAFEVAREEIGLERWLDVRYEDLVARPVDQTTAVLRFAGLDRWNGLESHLEWLRVSGGRTDAYREELRPEDVAMLDAVLAPTLERWGYTTPAAASSPE
jgi:Sulfotransferase family